MLKLQPVLERFAAWAEKNPTLLAAVIAGMGILAVSILAVNAAMLLNPAVAITAAVIALGVAVVMAYKKFEGFRNVVKSVINGVLSYVEFMVNGWIKAVNIIIKAMNLIPGVNIKEIGGVSFGRMGGEPGKAPGIHDSGAGMIQAPDLSSNNRGMGGVAGTGNLITVNVQGADPQAVVTALQRYVRNNGPVPVNIRNM